MSTFVGHSLAAAAIASCARRTVRSERPVIVTTLAVAAALLPDLDVLFLAVLGPGAVAHRGVSHGLLFAVATAGALTVAARPLARAPATRLFAVLLLAGLSHLLLDFLMGAGPPVRPFAPFDDRGFLAPIRLLPIAYYARAAEGYRSLAFWRLNAVAATLEALILAPALLVANPGGRARTRALAATLSVATLAVTLALYN
ncbi:metal-dependent hydrolase [Anaeromyxobacter terrae]|uniref:metal-dependent hydrolase n=1 Tax=Anaeromyxobacter terrae TaxID=2925406 RepID=UPI001F56E508|nr:metal-dependent hydrolase [Anaeromyxobacter sp. SG22]